MSCSTHPATATSSSKRPPSNNCVRIPVRSQHVCPVLSVGSQKRLLREADPRRKSQNLLDAQKYKPASSSSGGSSQGSSALAAARKAATPDSLAAAYVGTNFMRH